jgi:hypothetical protein
MSETDEIMKNIHISWNLTPNVWRTEVEELLRIFFNKVPNAEGGTYLVIKYHGFNIVTENQIYSFLIFTLNGNEVIPMFHFPPKPYQGPAWRATYFMRTAKNLIYSQGVLGYPELPDLAVYKIA